jgi:pimeloyl-ACP methyl ester carboxylesterase
VILLNAGLLHRVGASRLNVHLARSLANDGYPVLRFDFSGIGDSDARRDELALDESAVAEIGCAMDKLSEVSTVGTFVIIGLCSGADMAFNVAQTNPRVSGIVQIDAFSYRTWLYYLHRFTPRLSSRQSWSNMLSGRTYVGPFFRRVVMGWRSNAETAEGDSQTEDAADPYKRSFPPKADVAKSLGKLVDRGVRMLNIFTGGNTDYSYTSQYQHSFDDLDFQDLLTVMYMRDADHTLPDFGHQREVIAAVSRWLGEMPGRQDTALSA